ncbi:MAG: AAA family ATPase [Planctomycetes bacterium]|nr:AAA family ATPase [Planctomycetota bacterium]
MTELADRDTVFFLKVNAHRHSYNGTICQNAESFDCGAQENFRLSVCAKGSRDCIHLALFDQKGPDGPCFYVDRGPGQSAFLGKEKDFIGSIVILHSKSHHGGQGVDKKELSTYAVGWYRIGEMKRVEIRARDWWRVRPADGEWGRFVPDMIEVGRWRRMSVSMEESGYVRRLPLADARGFIEEIKRRHKEALNEQLAPALLRDAEKVSEQAQRFSEMLERAAKSAASDPHGALSSAGRFGSRGSAIPVPPKLGPIVLRPSTPPPTPTPSGASPMATPAAPVIVTPAAPPSGAGSTSSSALPSLGGEAIAAHFRKRGLGFAPELLERIERAVRTKPLVLLAGPTGTGKTALAYEWAELYADRGARRLLTPVQPSWHTREELLGYFNPITENYVSTPLVRFLHDAARAYAEARAAQRAIAPFFVVLDEFNLAPPEEYLAEFLSRLEIAADDEAGRTIELYPPDHEGAVRRFSGVSALPPKLRLSPNVVFLGTLNDDGREMPLSPRVLDRAHLIKVEPRPSEVLAVLHERHAALMGRQAFVSTLRGLIETLSRHRRGLGGRVLRDVLAYCESGFDGSDEAQLARALDQALLQRVLPALSFSALVPDDLEALEDLLRLCSDNAQGFFLGRSAGVLQGWVEQLQEQRDVSGFELREENASSSSTEER